MIREIIKILKGVVIAGLVITALELLGEAINSLAAWDYLTVFFKIIRDWGMKADFIWDMTTLFTLVGYGFMLLTAWAAYKALKWAVSFF